MEMRVKKAKKVLTAQNPILNLKKGAKVKIFSKYLNNRVTLEKL